MDIEISPADIKAADMSGGSDVSIESSPFNVHLDNFDGPFDLLLQLISRHKMDITEVSLSIVTDEFISFIRALEASGEGWRLDQATEFLVIAATLLDLKAARLLPSGEIEDEEDLALLACSNTAPLRRSQRPSQLELKPLISHLPAWWHLIPLFLRFCLRS